MAKTLLFLKERGLDNYELLVSKSTEVNTNFNDKLNKIKSIEAHQKEISELQRQIGTYGKTRDVYNEYKRLQKIKPTTLQKFTKTITSAEEFYENNRTNITLHETAKKYFNRLGYGKSKPLPKINFLKEEYAKLYNENRKLYSNYKSEREEMMALKLALRNVDMFLGESKQTRQTAKNHEQDLIL